MKNQDQGTQSSSPAHSHAECRFIDVMEIIGGKWRGTIIYCLMVKPMRFNELRDDIGGISSKVLTTELRALERDGLIAKTPIAGESGLAASQLSELGNGLVQLFERVENWMTGVLPDIYSARARYDSEQTTG